MLLQLKLHSEPCWRALKWHGQSEKKIMSSIMWSVTPSSSSSFSLSPNRKGKYMRADWPPQLLWPPLPATARTPRPALTMLLAQWTPQEPQQTQPRVYLEQQQVEGVKALKRWGSYLSTEPKRLTLCRELASLWPFCSSIYSTGFFIRYLDMKMYISNKGGKVIDYSVCAHTHTHTHSLTSLYCYLHVRTHHRLPSFPAPLTVTLRNIQDDLT